ncbi:DUF3500 domain-containing protein [Cryptosporangium sp. NPDC048952]|uniref:DUF3500 domain-containing protein n=1 Tax=Cryptosporangium sp. NPDC048952 TaxID=3363961 RepID=UPI00371CF526
MPELPTMNFEAPWAIKRMLFSTWALLDSLTPELRAQIHIPDMSDPRRVDWDFIPKPDRTGVPLTKLDNHQKTLAHTLLKAGLSLRGYSQVLAVMATENILRELEVIDREFGVIAGEFRSPDAYWFTVFGRPGFEDTWGWRVIGHHLSLNFTIVAQRYLTVTPLAMGALPIPAGVLDPLGAPARMAFDVLNSLSPDLRERAVIHDVAPADFVTRQVPQVGAEEWPDHVDLGIVGYTITDHDRSKLRFVKSAPSGVSGSDLSASEVAAVRQLMLYYVETGPEEISTQYRDQILREDPRKLHFAWAGGTRPDTAHYYRVSTQHLLVEADNAVAAGQHKHTVWRDLNNDLGHDLLTDHYTRHGHHGEHLERRLVSTRATDADALQTQAWHPPQVYVKP